MKHNLTAACSTICLTAIIGLATAANITFVDFAPTASAHGVSTCPTSRFVELDVQFSSDHIVVGETIKVTGELNSRVNRQLTVGPILPIIDKESVIAVTGDSKYFSKCNPPPPPISSAKELGAPDWQIVNASIPANSEGLIILGPGGNASFSIEIRSTEADVFYLMSGIKVIFNTAKGTETGVIYFSRGQTVFVLPEGLLSSKEDQLFLMTEKSSITYDEPFYYFGNVSKIVEGGKIVNITLYNSSGESVNKFIQYVDDDGFYRSSMRFSSLANQNYTIHARYDGKEANATVSYAPGFTNEYRFAPDDESTNTILARTTIGIRAENFLIHPDQNTIAVSMNSTERGVMELALPKTMIENVTAVNATIPATIDYSLPVEWQVLSNTSMSDNNTVIRIQVPSSASEIKVFGSLATEPEEWPSTYRVGSFPLIIGIGAAIASIIAFITLKHKSNKG